MVAQSIPASAVVNVTPGVVSAGGTALDLSGLILTSSTRPPIGTVLEFANPDDVTTYFGGGSTESALATVYFLGFDGSDVKPGALLFAQYNEAAVSGYVRGGPGITLAAVNSITSGTLAVTVDGVLKTSSALNLSASASFSAAATTITAAFTTPGFVVSYDSTAGAFVITSSTTGATSTIAVTTGANATTLKLTAATAAVTSPGAAAVVPADFLDALVVTTQNFASFTTSFELSTTNGLAVAAWVNAQSNRYAFEAWDTDANNAVAGSTTILKYLIDAAGYSGTSVTYAPVNGALIGAFVISFGACLNTSAEDGRADLGNRKQTGLPADVVSSTVYNTVIANNVDCYGQFGTANDTFLFYRKGRISGDFLWYDSYINQIWLNNSLQLAGMTLLSEVKSIPYNAAGDALIMGGLADPIDNAVIFGAIRSGVELSAAQKTVINNSAGLNISDILQTRGWYLQIVRATAQERAARSPRQVKLWYTDGQSVQGLNINSLEVQ